MLVLQDKVAVIGVFVGEGETLAGLIAEHVRPAGTVSVRVTGPEKPYKLPTLIVQAAAVPGLVASGFGDAEIVKSAMLRVK